MIPIGRGAEAAGTLDLAPTAPRVNSFAEVLTRIEAAARAEVIAEIRAGVEGLPRADGDSHWFEVDKRAVLALLPPTEPKL